MLNIGEFRKMSESKIQAQIDTRCPCMSKPLNACDCEPQIVYKLLCNYCFQENYLAEWRGEYCRHCGEDLNGIPEIQKRN